MSIRKKVLTIVGTVVVMLAVLMITITFVLTMDRYIRLEVKETRRQVQNINNALDSVLSQLESIAGDWAAWDDTYRFIEDSGTAYVESNLADATLSNLQLNFMLFFRADGKLMYSKVLGPPPSQPPSQADELLTALQSYPSLFKHASERSRVAGIVITPSMPYLTAAHPIVTTAFKGPIRGTLILGRALDAREVEKIGIANQTAVTITGLTGADDALPEARLSALQRPGQIVAMPASKDTISGLVTLSDLSGTPALLLEIRRNRDTYNYGLATWRQNALILSCLSLAFILLLMYLLDQTILNRLGDLTERVNQIAHCANCFEPLEIDTRDEIGQLAESINTMLQALQHYHAEKLDNEIYLRELLDSINCGVMVVDAADHLIMDVNRTGIALFQRQRRDIIGQQCHMLVCPNEIGNCPVTDQEKTIDLSERQLLQADGHMLPIIKSVSTIERRGRTFLIESFIDISKLKRAQLDLLESEERYRHFFEEDFTGDFLLSVDGRILECNPALARMFGFSHPDELKSTLLDGNRHISKEDRHRLLDRLRKEGRLVGVELELTHRNGQPLYCIGNLVGQFDDGGTLREIRGYLFDDTKRVLMEKDLRQAQKMEAIGTLAGGIAHDFNNILASIMGYTEIAMSELPDDHPAAGRLQLVVKSANRAKDLVHQILAFSRQTEGEHHPLSPNPIIKEVAKLMRASLPSTIEIRENLDTSAKIMANPVQIRQMVVNLCTNAGYAMKKNGGRLSIRAADTFLDKSFTDHHPGVQQGAFVRISVADTGPGISPDVIDRIFDPFFSTKDKNEGAGLGLSVVHGIVCKLKGAITVDSTHQGTQIDVYLPALDEVRQSRPIPPSKSLPAGSESVVFIDDEEPLVDIGTHMLGSLGYRVIGFTDSRKALAHIQGNGDQIDLVITDMTMPGLTGLALAKRLREAAADLPIILCTGYSEEVSEKVVQALGIRGYVMKPMVIKELAAEVRKVLDAGPPANVPGQAAGA